MKGMFKKMKKLQELFSVVLCALFVFLLFSSCKKNENESLKLVMWTFQNQIDDQMVEAFEKLHGNIDVEVVVFPWDTYFTKLRLALQSGNNVPDIFQLEVTYLGDFIFGEESQYMYDLNSLGGENLVKNMIPYVAELGRNQEGQLFGICDHTCVAGYNYNKEAALKYLGTSDYMELQNMVHSWSDIVELSKEVSEKGGYLIPSLEDIISVEKYNNGHWVDNGQFVINSSWNNVIDICRSVKTNNGDAGLIFETDAYESAKYDGNVVFWMASFENYVDEELNNKLGLIKAPKPYYLGGTYNCIYNQSKYVEEAYKFLEYISQDEWQEKDLLEYAVLPSSESLFEKYKGQPVWIANGSQPVLDTYFDIAKRIEPCTAAKYDEQIYLIFVEEVLNGLNNNLSNEEIFEAVRSRVMVVYPELFG